MELDPEQSRRDRLVLRGRGVLDRRAYATGKWASSLDPTIRLGLAVHARRVAIHPSTERHEGNFRQAAEPDRGGASPPRPTGQLMDIDPRCRRWPVRGRHESPT
jgi:hypothetical protein